MSSTFQLNIVSAERSLFSGQIRSLVAPGMLGDLGVHSGHAPLLTPLKAGTITMTSEDGSLESFYVSGGFLEVQPKITTVLADTAIRANDLDSATILAAKESAEIALSDKQSEIDYSKAATELAQAIAQLKTLRMIKK
jgi:F-type H+-transporting ATPase subunit epsilon